MINKVNFTSNTQGELIDIGKLTLRDAIALLDNDIVIVHIMRCSSSTKRYRVIFGKECHYYIKYVGDSYNNVTEYLTKDNYKEMASELSNKFFDYMDYSIESLYILNTDHKICSTSILQKDFR